MFKIYDPQNYYCFFKLLYVYGNVIDKKIIRHNKFIIFTKIIYEMSVGMNSRSWESRRVKFKYQAKVAIAIFIRGVN